MLPAAEAVRARRALAKLPFAHCVGAGDAQVQQGVRRRGRWGVVELAAHILRPGRAGPGARRAPCASPCRREAGEAEITAAGASVVGAWPCWPTAEAAQLRHALTTLPRVHECEQGGRVFAQASEWGDEGEGGKGLSRGRWEEGYGRWAAHGSVRGEGGRGDRGRATTDRHGTTLRARAGGRKAGDTSVAGQHC